MTPSKASTVFRELLQTDDAELAMFARRAGLVASPAGEDLLKARELLQTVAAALESGASRDWDKVRAAWAGLRTKQDLFSPAAMGPSATAEPAKPPMVERFVVSKPSLGDLAPGVPGQAEQAKAKFVPVAKPKHMPPSAGAPGGPLPAPAPQQPMASPYGAGAASDDWPPPLPAPPPMLAPLGPTQEVQGVSSPFTRAEVVAPPALYAAPGGLPAYAPAVAAPYAPPAMTPAPAPAPGSASVSPAAAPPPPKRRAAASAGVSGSAPAAAAGAALDQSAGSVSHSVAKYAAFCAACAEFPERLAHTMAGYGVANEALRAQLDQLWQDRFDDDPDLLAKWEELFQSFRTSLRALG